jgi:hypothetical protein
MQISRHWRIKSQRYRLEGVRFENGEVSVQTRPAARDDMMKLVSSRDTQSAAQAQPVLAGK